MHKHFFAYRKWEHGRPTPIQIEVVIALPNRDEARRIAKQEVEALLRGHRVVEVRHEGKTDPTYVFVGVN